MEPTPGAASFLHSGSAYDGFMGRWSRPLAEVFADFAGVASGQVVLDVGCGPGALTGLLAQRLGTGSVSACDPSPSFVADCVARHPDVDVRAGRGEELPFEDSRFDAVLAQLVLHFVSDAEATGREFLRVLRPGGVAAACVWDFDEGMQMLRHFWDAALDVVPDAPDESNLRFGREREIADLLVSLGFEEVREATLTVTSTYTDFEELWTGFLAGIGPAGSFCVGLPEGQRGLLRQRLFERLDQPAGPFTLSASARSARGRSPA